MPVPMLKAMASKSGKSLSDLERYWADAKKSASTEGKSGDYAYIVGIVKKRAGISEASPEEDEFHDRMQNPMQPGGFVESVFQKYERCK